MTDAAEILAMIQAAREKAPKSYEVRILFTSPITLTDEQTQQVVFRVIRNAYDGNVHKALDTLGMVCYTVPR